MSGTTNADLGKDFGGGVRSSFLPIPRMGVREIGKCDNLPKMPNSRGVPYQSPEEFAVANLPREKSQTPDGEIFFLWDEKNVFNF